MIPALSGVELSSGLERRTGRRPEDGGAGELFHDALGRATGAPEVRERPRSTESGSAPSAEAPVDRPVEDGEPGDGVEASVDDGVVAEGEEAPTEPPVTDGKRTEQRRPSEGVGTGEARTTPVPSSPVPAKPNGGGVDRPPVEAGSGAGTKPTEALGGAAGMDEDEGTRSERPSDDEPVRPERVPRDPKASRVRVSQDGRAWLEPVIDRQPGVAPVAGQPESAQGDGKSVPVTVPSATAQETVPRAAQGAVRAEVAQGVVTGVATGTTDSSGSQDGAAWRDERGAQGQPAGDAARGAQAGRAESAVRVEGAAQPAAGADGAVSGGPAVAQGGAATIGVRLGGAQNPMMGSAGTAGRGVQDAQSAGFEGAVTRGFSAVLRQSGGSVVIRLIPETLGPLRISMTLDKSSVSVMLDASTPQAHELLTSNLGSLRQSLESQGLRVDRMGVTLTQSGPPSTGPSGAESAAHHRGSEDPGGGGQDAAGERSRGHWDQSSRDRRGGAHADPTPPFGSFSELIEASGVPVRFVATA